MRASVNDNLRSQQTTWRRVRRAPSFCSELSPADVKCATIETARAAHFRQSAKDLRASFDTLGFESRLKLLEFGVVTLTEPLRM